MIYRITVLQQEILAESCGISMKTAMKQVNFVELMNEVSERNIAWVNVANKKATLYKERKYYWSGKYEELFRLLSKVNEEELLVETTANSAVRRIKQISDIGYKVVSVCDFGKPNGDKFDLVYYILKRA